MKCVKFQLKTAMIKCQWKKLTQKFGKPGKTEMRCVIDTNALVSALINSRGKPAMVMDMVKEGRITAVFDIKIIY